jgi:hypothetical protein
MSDCLSVGSYNDRRTADAGFKIAGRMVVLQQDAVFERLMPAFDFALGLRIVRGATTRKLDGRKGDWWPAWGAVTPATSEYVGIARLSGKVAPQIAHIGISDATASELPVRIRSWVPENCSHRDGQDLHQVNREAHKSSAPIAVSIMSAVSIRETELAD